VVTRPDESTRARREAATWHARMLEPTSQAEVDAFEAWLAADPVHPRAYAAMEALTSAGARLPRHVLSDAPQRPDRSRWRRASAAVLATLVAVAGLFAWQLGSSPALARVSNAGPAVQGYRFPDGTGVILDAGAEIATGLRARQRQIVVVKGRVRVDTRISAQPARISAGATEISADDTLIDVTAERGKVSVATLEGNAFVTSDSSSAARLEQGRAAAFDPEGRHAITYDTTWPASRMRFVRATLGRIVEVANRFGTPRIALADPSLGQIPVTGVLDLRRARPLARKLAAALGLHVSETQGALMLSR